MPVTHGPTKCRMRQVGWKIVLCVIPSDFCCMKSDGVGWNAFRSISQNPRYVCITYIIYCIWRDSNSWNTCALLSSNNIKTPNATKQPLS